MSASRARHATFALIFAFTLIAGIVPVTAAAEPKPNSMAATGDSITRAFNLCFFPFSDCPAQSWSTGTSSTVNSHARRLNITGSAFNDAKSGAKMSDLPGQATTVFNRNVGYVTVLMGGNDVCTDTEALMTSPSSYEANFQTAMEKLKTDTTPPLVYVVSVPNVKNLWEILHSTSSARNAWSSYNVCQSLLANPLSTAQADVDRRERVKQRNMELNQRLRAVCGNYTFCRFDGEASFGTAFVPNDVSTRDYFHPSTAGQAKLASVSYDNGYWGSKAVNGAPTALFTRSCAGLACTFTDASSDLQGIGGRSWDLGDSRTSVASSFTHTYAAEGTYTVTLHAIDAFGATASVRQTFTVAGTSGVISTGALAGTVTDPNGPIAGASVTITNATYSVGTTTGTDGSYIISNVPVGDYTATASATGHDGLDQAATISKDVITPLDFALTVSGGGTPAMRVADLAESSANVSRNHWQATVVITVFDSGNAPVEGATGNGTWSVGSAKSCTTGSTGTCSVTSDNLSRKTVESVTFAVTGVTHATLAYNEDASVTTVVVKRPT